MAWLTPFAYRQKISIDADTYISGNLTDFTIAVNVPSSRTDFWTNEDGDGTYVRFTSSDGETELKFQVESYDATGDDAWFHVKIPTLSASVNTDIYIYYSSLIPSDGSDKEGTWDSSYNAVYHLNENQAEGAFDDATSNNNDGTNDGTDDAAGQIDRGRDFVQANTDHIDIPDSNSLSFGDGSSDTAFSIEVWTNMDDATTFRWMTKGTSGADQEWGFGTTGTDFIFFVLYDADNSNNIIAVSDAAVTSDEGSWVHFGATYDGGGSETGLTLYRNGAVFASTNSENGTYVALHNFTDTGDIGRFMNLASNHSDGLIDELTLSGAERSLDWMKARYQSGLGTWLTFSAQEAEPALTGYDFSEALPYDGRFYIDAALTNQTVVVNIDSSYTQFWANEDGNGTYVRFTLDNLSTLLDFEVESYDATGDDAWFHVKIPLFSAITTTTIYIHYGHASPSDGSDKENTWDSSYKAVYHLNQDKSEGAFDDSTVNNQDGTNTGSTDAAGGIDRGRDFNGTTHKIAIGTLPTMTVWTIESVVNSDVLGSEHNILSNDISGFNDDVLFGIRPEGTGAAGTVDDRLSLVHQDSGSSVRTFVEDTVDMVASTVYHVVVTSDGSSLRLYVNGTLKDTTAKAGTALTFNGATTWIGATPNTFRGWNGVLDEITVSDVCRTQDWVSARYESSILGFASVPDVVKRKAVTITGTTAGVQTDYWVKVEVDFVVAMRSDYTDVRFRAADGTTALNQFLYKQDGTSAWFMVEVPSIPASPSTIDIYYYYNTGQSTLTEPPNTSDACMDDFRSTRFPRAWTRTGSFSPSLVAQGDDIAVASWGGTDDVYITTSSDRGQTWDNRGNLTLGKVPGIEVTLDESRLLIVAGNTGGDLKFAYSTDGGDTFSTPVTIASGRQLDSAILAISNTEYIVASGTSAATEITLYETTNSGTSWSVKSTIITGLSVAQEDVDLYFADNGDLICSFEEESVEQGKSEVHLVISDDNGSTWGSKINVWTQGATSIDYEQAGFFTDTNSGDLVSLVYTNEGDVFDSDYTHYKFRYKTSSDNGATWGSSSEYDTIRGVGPENNTAVIDSDLFICGYVFSGSPAYLFMSKYLTDLTLNYNVAMISERFNNTQGFAYCFGTLFSNTYIEINPGVGHATSNVGFYETVATIPNDCRILAKPAGTQVRTGFRTTDDLNFYEYRHAGSSSIVYKVVNDVHTSLDSVADSSGSWASGFDVEILVSGTSIKTYRDEVLKNDFTDATYSSGDAALIGAVVQKYHYFFAGKYVDPEPTHVVGAAEDVAGSILPELLDHVFLGRSYNG